MTRFLVDGKLVELDELVEKAKKYDVIVEEHYALRDKVALLEERCARKLKAIMVWFKEHEDSIDPDYWDSSAREELRKILHLSTSSAKVET